MDSIVVLPSVKILADAYDRFFRKQSADPRFKSYKNGVQSYTTEEMNRSIGIIGKN